MTEELKTVLREIGAAGYDRGYGDAAAGRNNAPRRSAHGPSDRGPGDAVEYLHREATARAYHRDYDDRVVVAVAADAPWPPAAGRALNDAVLEQLYADAG